jgi:hypothetical protein
MIDEPGFISTRTDASAYADRALTPFEDERVSFRVQCHIRDAIESAFEDGEMQGEFRALWILVVAEKRADSPEALALIRRCIALLAPDIQGWEIE